MVQTVHHQSIYTFAESDIIEVSIFRKQIIAHTWKNLFRRDEINKQERGTDSVAECSDFMPTRWVINLEH